MGGRGSRRAWSDGVGAAGASPSHVDGGWDRGFRAGTPPDMNFANPPRNFLATLLALLAVIPARADVVINEVMSAGSERALQWSAAGLPSFGFGTRWTETAFNDAGWQTGTGPFGFGTFANVTPAPTVGTSPATQMQNLTPTLCLRKTFTVSAGDAARLDPLRLDVQFNDGFVCYVNGVEVARQNAGPVNGFVYHDQFAAFGTPANSEANTTPYARSTMSRCTTAGSRTASSATCPPWNLDAPSHRRCPAERSCRQLLLSRADTSSRSHGPAAMGWVRSR